MYLFLYKTPLFNLMRELTTTIDKLGLGLSVSISIILISTGFWYGMRIIWLIFVIIALLNFLNLITNNKIPGQKFGKVQKDIIDGITSFLKEKTSLLIIPIISGLIVFCFPIIANLPGASRFIKNLFSMRSDLQSLSVILISSITAIMIVSLGKTILELEKNQKVHNKFREIVLPLVIVLPTWISILLNSYIGSFKEDGVDLSSFIVGVIISVAILVISGFFDWDDNLEKYLAKPEKPLDIRSTFYLSQISIGFVLYFCVIFAYRPKVQEPFLGSEAPALLYLFIIIWIFTFILGGVTHLADRLFNGKETPNENKLNEKELDKNVGKESNNSSFQLGALTLIVLFMGFSYFAWQVDHYFKLIPIANKPEEIEYKNAFRTAIEKRLSNQTGEEKTLVVVAASGGGIQASGWTTQVLAGLQQEKELGEDFTKAIGLISSTSGGSVGTMFYLDQFEDGVLSQDGSKKQEELTTVVAKSTDDWLDSVGWGLAFPDLFRVIGFPFPNIFKQFQYLDRGYSLEQDWQRGFNNPETEVTLDTWYQEILEGKIPIPVFNSTLVENGRRFLISPMKFIPGSMPDYIVPKNEKFDEIKALDFKTLYADACNEEEKQQSCDLNVTTAARLSASFPYVSPVARNDRDNAVKIKIDNKDITVVQNYHMADGGYFDNYGIYTAIEWLNEFLDDYRDELKIKKVLLVQINAFPISQLKQEERGEKGIGSAILAPLRTLNGVRASTQLERNIEEIGLLKKRWDERKESDRVQIKYFELSFPEKIEGEVYNPPLSWRLTKQQKNNLKVAWEKDPTIRAEVNNIKTCWQSDTSEFDKCDR